MGTQAVLTTRGVVGGGGEAARATSSGLREPSVSVKSALGLDLSPRACCCFQSVGRTVAAVSGLGRTASSRLARHGQASPAALVTTCTHVAALDDLPPDAVAAVTLALGNMTPKSQMIFWLREHGALAGQTAVAAVRAGRLARVATLAMAWTMEDG